MYYVQIECSLRGGGLDKFDLTLFSVQDLFINTFYQFYMNFPHHRRYKIKSSPIVDTGL